MRTAHRFANVEEVQMVYDRLEAPKTTEQLVRITNMSPSQVDSALRILFKKKRIVMFKCQPPKYQWRH